MSGRMGQERGPEPQLGLAHTTQSANLMMEAPT